MKLFQSLNIWNCIAKTKRDKTSIPVGYMTDTLAEIMTAVVVCFNRCHCLIFRAAWGFVQQEGNLWTDCLKVIQGSWYAELMLPLLFICVTRGKIKTERSLRAELYLASLLSVLWRNFEFILGKFLEHPHRSVCPIFWQLYISQ